MSVRLLPRHVRMHVYLFWAGMAVAGLGVLGFFLSFGQVASRAQATVDVHEDIPLVAYGSIAGWAVGLAFMWYGRRAVDAAVRQRVRERREEMIAALEAPERPAEGARPGEALGDTLGEALASAGGQPDVEERVEAEEPVESQAAVEVQGPPSDAQA